MITVTTTTAAEAQAMTELMRAAPPEIAWSVHLLGRKIAGREPRAGRLLTGNEPGDPSALPGVSHLRQHGRHDSMCGMAEVVSDSVWAQRRSGRPTIYPWAEWLDGQTRILTRGQDFQVTAMSLRNTVQVNGGRHGFQVRTRILDEDRIQLQAILP